MNCGIHAEREAVGMCVDCGTYICQICLNKEAGKMYCDACAQMRASISGPSSRPLQPYASSQQSITVITDKNKVAAGVLALVLGSFGAHKFYVGEIRWGIAYFLFSWTFIPMFAGWIEGLIYLSMQDERFAQKYGSVLRS